ncbi:MAG: DivIVA domain-containing protein [Firmicutes bacterium]|nr:DivIVA domain-containing protein [Bacillota bacterium]
MKKFSRELGGYNKSEVNALLNEVINHTESVLAKVEEQKKEIATLNEQLMSYQGMEQSIEVLLSRAEEIGTRIKNLAEQEAEQIIADAKKDADIIINDALDSAEKLEERTTTLEKGLHLLKKRLRLVIEQQQDIIVDIDILNKEEI